MKNVKSKNLVKLTQLSILVAIIILMAFTPLGFFKAGVIEITLITIPVVIGAIVLGPTAGAILGGVFGITSFAQCFGMSAFGTMLMGINPFFTFILCLVPRILMGYLSGLIFKGLARVDRTRIVSYGVASLSGALLNTILFVVGLMLMFGNSSYINEMRGGQNVLAFMVAFVGINGVVEAIVTLVLGTAISKPLSIYFKK